MRLKRFCSGFKLLFIEVLLKGKDLMYALHHDSLSGLYRREALEELGSKLLAVAHRQGKPVSVVFIDFDGFKQVNDTLGHHAGDELIAGFGQILRRVLRQSDAAFRVGGDEFVVLLSDSTSQQATEWARRLAGVLNKAKLQIQFSHGIHVWIPPRQPQAIDFERELGELIRAADDLMYLDKPQPRPRRLPKFQVQ